ncbi:MAG: P1 family peptidase [Acidimicrobiales bacterium]
MLTEVGGIRVGHWTDRTAMTGCTVVLLPEGTVASGEVRGGAPATREFALLEPHRTVDRVNAVVLCGGSAFGLAAADGVMRFCEEQGIGFATPAGVVPIVVGMALYDLAVGDATVRPRAADGYRACAAADSGPVEVGAVGAGTGATVGVWPGGLDRRPGGLGGAVERHSDLVVAALVAVNAFGGGFDDQGARLPAVPSSFGNTTIGVVATNATLSKLGCSIVAQSAHDGLARALKPAHTRFDGDALVVAATATVAAVTADTADAAGTGLIQPVDVVRELAPAAVEAAIRRVVDPH